MDPDRDAFDAPPQRQLPTAMPTRLPVIPGLQVDAQYVRAGGRTPVGRAWFDVLALPDGRAAMLVGEAVEPGIPPAAVARVVRTELGHLLADGQDLTPALERLNHRVGRFHAKYATTACVALIDPIEARVEYGTCGYHAPLVVDGVGTTRYLEPTGGGVLGTDQPAGAGAASLSSDDVLVLCTDALSPETRHAMTARLATRQRETLAPAGDSPASQRPVRTAAVCRTTTEAIRGAHHRSGLAVLALTPRSAPPQLAVTFPAVAASLGTARRAVESWLSGLMSSVEDGAGMALAIGEALANSIQHAYVGARPGAVSIEAGLLAGGVLACSIRDDGRWSPSSATGPARQGRGLSLMAQVTDSMELSRGLTGTVVELRRRLHHPVISDA